MFFFWKKAPPPPPTVKDLLTSQLDLTSRSLLEALTEAERAAANVRMYQDRIVRIQKMLSSEGGNSETHVPGGLSEALQWSPNATAAMHTHRTQAAQ